MKQESPPPSDGNVSAITEKSHIYEQYHSVVTPQYSAVHDNVHNALGENQHH